MRSLLARASARRFSSSAAKLYEATVESDRKIVDAVGAVATGRAVSRARIALAWLYRNPIVDAPIVGALKTEPIDDAIEALSITLTDDEVASRALGRLFVSFLGCCEEAVSMPREAN
jgi:aryl-alcohol dehydrogenase-like predicted oxidoreductase